MNRRRALQSIAAGVLGLSAADLARAAEPRAATRRKIRNWVWMPPPEDFGAGATDEWKRLFARMSAAGIDALIPELYDGLHAYWTSTRLPVKTDWLGRLLPLARAEGLEVHAWMWTMPCRVDEIVKKHPDWYTVNAKGESAVDKPAYVDYYKFLDPARPEVREFVQGTVQELAAIDGVRGVHLDYVRHPDAILPRGLWSKYGLVQDKVYPEFDYGYTPYSREQFKKAHGIDPMAIEDKTAHKEWMQYRYDSVTALVNDYLVPAAKAAGKEITAAVFPGPTLARELVRQDWGRWKLDGYLPMLYRTFYEEGTEWVGRQLHESVRTVDAPVYSGLLAPTVDAAGLAADVRVSLESGAAGVSIFEWRSMTEEKWKAFEGATAARAARDGSAADLLRAG